LSDKDCPIECVDEPDFWILEISQAEHLMPSRKAAGASCRNRISIDLQGSKDTWDAWCASVSMTPSEALRELVGRLKPGQWPRPSRSARARLPHRDRAALVDARPKVPLTEEEWARVSARAAQEDLTVPRWIVALIRAHLAEQPQLGSSSLDALRKSNLEVQAVGRNLNQLVRALNAINDHLAHGRLGAAEEGLRSQRGQHVRELVQQIRTTIERHLPLVSEVLTDNVNRWRTRLHARSRSRGRNPGAST
jgi:hypothetical protein